MTTQRYEVILHAERGCKPFERWDGNGTVRDNRVTVYEGDDETVMYSHVSAMEFALMTAHAGKAEIEIIEHGQSRWIEYANGRRSDI